MTFLDPWVPNFASHWTSFLNLREPYLGAVTTPSGRSKGRLRVS